MKLFILFLSLFCSTFLFAANRGQVQVTTLLNNVSSTGAGSSFIPLNTNRTFQGSGTAAGAGACTMLVQVSNDDVVWTTDATLSLTLSASTSSAIHNMDEAWKYVRGNVTAISGTNATVSLNIGVQL